MSWQGTGVSEITLIQRIRFPGSYPGWQCEQHTRVRAGLFEMFHTGNLTSQSPMELDSLPKCHLRAVLGSKTAFLKYFSKFEQKMRKFKLMTFYEPKNRNNFSLAARFPDSTDETFNPKIVPSDRFDRHSDTCTPKSLPSRRWILTTLECW